MKITILLSFFIFNLFAGEKDLYNFEWLDPDKVVYVLQNKVFEKKFTWYLNFGYGFSTDSDFQDTKTLQGKTGFFATEEWGIELLYSTVTNKDNQTMDNISTNIDSVPFVRRLKSYYGGAIIFAPFYGKINTFNQIFYFDWNFGLGATQMNGETNMISFNNQDKNNTYTVENKTGILFKSELRFYVTELINLNIDLIKMFYSVNSLRNPGQKLLLDYTDLIFSLGISI